MSDRLVICEAVTKSYGKGAIASQALRGVNLELYAGELLMLVGPSGSGKTTLISIIAGILERDGGRCEVMGADYEHFSEKQRALHRQKEIGFVFQAFNLIPTLTVAENIAIPLLIGSVGWREAMDRASTICEQVGLLHKFRSRPRQLSGGEQQRVAIARAVVHQPRLVVCDEPTSSLDHETGIKTMNLLKEMTSDPGRALLVVTHDSRIFEFADRIAMMEDGRILQVKNRSDK